MENNQEFHKDKRGVIRTTKVFTAKTNGFGGGFPVDFIPYLKKMGWWGEKRIHLCSGGVIDTEAERVDIRQETNPTVCCDARNTPFKEETFDFCLIDPPYSEELAHKLYGTRNSFASINQFTKEASRIVKKGGLIITLTYEIPKIPPKCKLLAVIGVYQIPLVSFMRCLAVFEKV